MRELKLNQFRDRMYAQLKAINQTNESLALIDTKKAIAGIVISKAQYQTLNQTNRPLNRVLLQLNQIKPSYQGVYQVFWHLTNALNPIEVRTQVAQSGSLITLILLASNQPIEFNTFNNLLNRSISELINIAQSFDPKQASDMFALIDRIDNEPTNYHGVKDLKTLLN